MKLSRYEAAVLGALIAAVILLSVLVFYLTHSRETRLALSPTTSR